MTDLDPGGGTGAAHGTDSPLTPQRLASTLDQARLAAAEFVGRKLVNAASSITAVVSQNTLRKMLSESAVRKSETPAAHATAVANVDICFESAEKTESAPDQRGDVNLQTIHRFAVSLLVDGTRLSVKKIVKEFVRISEGNRIYSVEAVKIKRPAGNWAASISAGRQRIYAPQAGLDSKLAHEVKGVNPEPNPESAP